MRTPHTSKPVNSTTPTLNAPFFVTYLPPTHSDLPSSSLHKSPHTYYPSSYQIDADAKNPHKYLKAPIQRPQHRPRSRWQTFVVRIYERLEAPIVFSFCFPFCPFVLRLHYHLRVRERAIPRAGACFEICILALVLGVVALRGREDAFGPSGEGALF